METFRDFEREKHKNWFKGVVALRCLQKPLERLIDAEIGHFHLELFNKCDAKVCVKTCDLKSWKPRPNERPPFDCEACCLWRDAILDNHTSPRGKVMWVNSKPHLWSRDKWEVAKVYMPGGHKDHYLIGDFDIAALLCVMKQCKHFEHFRLAAVCDKVSNVRNDLYHAPSPQLEQEVLNDFLNRIRELGEVLAMHDPEFRSLSEDITEIQNLDYMLMLPDTLLNEIRLAVAEEQAEHCLTRMKLEKMERQFAQLMCLTGPDYYALTHNPRGLCVVFNNENFQGTQLRKRVGTQEDARALRTVFTRLGFTVVVHDDLTSVQMQLELSELGTRNFSDEDALVVCVLSHGEEGTVYGTDMQHVPLRELTEPFTSGRAPTLAGKPKLFFIQACQGSSFIRGSVPCPPRQRVLEADGGSHLQEDAGPVHGNTVPWEADFLLGMATMMGCQSFRNTVTGSIYIQELCRQLMKSAESAEKDDILTVLTRVNREVSRGEFLSYKQMPEPKYTLTKKLVLKCV